MKQDLSPRIQSLAACHGRSATMRLIASLTLGAMWLVAGAALAQNNTLRVYKGFSPSPVAVGSPSQMTITLYNTDTAGPQTNVSVTDNFPANLSWTSLVSNGCGGTLNSPGTSLLLTGAMVPAASAAGSSQCTLVVNVAATAAGSYTNTIESGGATGEVSGSPTANNNAASNTLSVISNQRVTGTKTFVPSTMVLGESGSFTIRINNPNTFAISDVAVTDNLASGANITSMPVGSGLTPTAVTGNTCGGTATISGGAVSLSGGGIPAGGFCTVVVSFTASAAATYTNRLPVGAITVASVPGINSAAVISGSVAVQASAVTMTKAFSVDEATYPTPFGLRLTFRNNTSLPVQNLAVTDNFPDSNGNGVPDLVVSELSGPILENTCGGTVTAPALATSISLVGGSIPANGSCTIYIRVRGSESVPAFSSINTTGECGGGLVGGSSFTCPVASDFVTLRGRGDGAVVVGLSKSYLSNNVNAGTVVRGRLVLATPELANVVGYTLTDTFQAYTSQGAASDVLLAPTGGNFTFQNCGAGAIAVPLAGENGFTVSNISINALSGAYAGGTGGAWTNAACIVEFDVVGVVTGTHRNIIPIDQGTARLETDPAGVTRTVLNRRVETGFTYLSPLSVSKMFSPSVVTHGGMSRLTIRLNNSNNQSPITNLSLTDNLPAAGATVNVLVAPSPNIINTCGGSITANPGTGTIQLAGGAALAAAVAGIAGLCEISLDVIARDGIDGSQDFLNRIAAGTVTGNINGATVSNNSNADANVYVRSVGMTVSKAFSPAQIDGGQTSAVTITIVNPNASSWLITGINLVDGMPAGMVVADSANASTTCTTTGLAAGASATVVATAGAGSFTLSNGALYGSSGTPPAGGMSSCSVTVTVRALISDTLINTIRVGDITSTNGAVNSNAYSATLVALPNTSVSKRFIPSVIPVGGISELEIEVLNANGGGATNIQVQDVMPAQVLIADPLVVTPVDTCPGLNVSATPGSNSLQATGLNLGANERCRFRVQVTSLTPGTFTNTIASNQVSSNEGGIRTENATDDLTVVNGPVVAKSFADDSFASGASTQLTMRVTNPATGGTPLTNVVFVDNLPAGMTLANPVNLATTGACGTGTVTAAAGAGVVTWSGGTLAGNAFCEITVDVTATTVGTYTNLLPVCDLTATPPVAGSTAAATGNDGNSVTCNTAGAQDVVEVIVPAELSFIKALANESIAVNNIAQADEDLTYTITITNSSSTGATAVPVIDLVPANTTFVSADNGGALNGAQVEWTVDVPGESDVVLTVVFRVADPIPAGVTAIANNATVNGETCATLPCVSTPTEEPGFTIAKVVSAESGSTAGIAEPGEQLTYTITVTNTSGANAEDVAVEDLVPTNTAFVSADNGGLLNGGQVEWTLDIAANSSIDLQVVFAVADPLPSGVTSIANNATVNGEGCSTVPCVETPAASPEFTISKAVTGEDGATTGVAEAGEQLTYTITVSNTSAVNATGVPVVDMVPANTSFISADNGGALNGSQVEWVLDIAANSSATLQVVFAVVNPLPAGVTSIDNNATVDGETCVTVPCVSTPTETPSFVVSKTLSAEDGPTPGFAEPGEQLTYAITVTNTSGTNAEGVAVVDMVPANTSFVSASDAGVLNGAQVEWTVDVPARGSITRTVTFRVADPIPSGVITIANNATANGSGCATTPCVETPVATPSFEFVKELTGEDGLTAGVAEAGEQLTYAITVTNTSNANALAVPVVDIVPANTTFVSADNGGMLNGSQVQWALDINANSSVTLQVVFQVADPVPADVTTIINNATVNGEGCTTTPCVETPVGRPQLEFAKALTSEGGVYAGIVEPGEQLTYTITIDNTGNAAAAEVAVIDLLDANVTFVSADNGGTLSGTRVNWTVPRIDPGQTVVLTVVVRAPAVFPSGMASLINNAIVDGERCATEPCVATPLARPPVAIDDNGGVHQVGTAVTLPTPGNDQPGSAPLDPTSVWVVGTSGPNVSLPVAGEGTWSVNPATGEITFTPEAGFSGNPTPIRYTIADTLGLRSNEAVESLEYSQELLLRLSKKASVRTVVVGDLVQYTLTIENIGDIDVIDTTVQDLPPNGFTLVPGSLRVFDQDNSGTLVSTRPVRIDDIDVAKGQTATITYLMAVGAGTLPGAHTNTAIVLSNEVPISNEATATVTSSADPLLEQSLIIGTVFNDRDGDAWQDSAKASGLMVSGGLDESAYVAGSTTVDRGEGPQPQADASAPINHGLKLGMLEGRNTVAEPEGARRIVISQRMREARFNDAFVLTTDEGTTVRMDASGKLSTERSGDAAKGLTAQDIRVQRNVVSVEGGEVRVDYVISNAGIDERGIPGVRIGTVEGLLVETDGYGRFHLEGVTPSHFARGSNFVMKVDTATLPRGSTFTTENPRVKRVTPGVMTRFDFGVKVPETVIEGGHKSLEMSLGEVVFEANSAVIRPQYVPVVEHMAGEVRKHEGGEVDITGFGGNPELALARAKAVHEAMLARLSAEIGQRVQVKVRGETDGAEVLTYGNRISLGEVFFDTDKSAIKPAFVGLIHKIAAELEARNLDELLITGHTDKRGSDAYNLALGKRRAQAVQQAIGQQLSPERRARLKVEYLPPSSADAPYEPARGK